MKSQLSPLLYVQCISNTIEGEKVKRSLQGFLLALSGGLLMMITLMPVQQVFAQGSIWMIVKSPNGSTQPVSNNLLLGATTIASNDIWSVGYFNSNTLTEHWNGTQWTLIQSPNGLAGSSMLTAVSAVSSHDVWAVGIQNNGNGVTGNSTLIEHWDGSKWSVVPSPNASTEGDELYGVAAISMNDVWAVGYFENNAETLILPLLEHWNGTSWSIAQDPPVNSGINFVEAVTATATNNVWAVGYVNNSGDNENLILHFDGTQWSVLPAVPVQSDGNALQSVVATSATDAWAVGRKNINQGESSSTMILHWNGTTWSSVASPNNGTLTNSLWGVTSLSSNDVWAVGLAEQPPDGFNQTLIEHWNGKIWSIVASPNKQPQSNNPNTLFAATSIAPGNVMAVGTWDSFKKGNPGSRTLILQTTQG